MEQNLTIGETILMWTLCILIFISLAYTFGNFLAFIIDKLYFEKKFNKAINVVPKLTTKDDNIVEDAEYFLKNWEYLEKRYARKTSHRYSKGFRLKIKLAEKRRNK